MKLLPQSRKAWARAIVVMLSPFIVIFSLLWYGGGGPGESFTGTLPATTIKERSLSERLQAHVVKLATDIGIRTLDEPLNYSKTTAYITSIFSSLGYTVKEHSFNVGDKTAVNLIAELAGTTNASEIVVVGAHFDTYPSTPGANDNASGVAAMLELARHFATHPQKRTIRFVAFTNEEPPYFQKEHMGSLVYAKACAAKKEKITAMLSLETIGSYFDEPGTQNYPKPLDLRYPDTGNFIAFVSNVGSGALVRRAIGVFRAKSKFPSEMGAYPDALPGIGWSDHWSFWQAGYPAIMITDTATFRYTHYHQPEDTPDKLDYNRMARVVEGIVFVLEDLAEK